MHTKIAATCFGLKNSSVYFNVNFNVNFNALLKKNIGVWGSVVVKALRY